MVSAAELSRVDPRSAAGPIFGRFADTLAVVLVIGDDGFSSVAIDPYDTEEFIGTPDGQTYPPHITRPVLPLQDTLRRLVEELTPDLTIDDVDNRNHVSVDLVHIIETECAKAQVAVVTEGKKVRTDAKKETWPNFDQLPLLVSLCEEAATAPRRRREQSSSRTALLCVTYKLRSIGGADGAIEDRRRALRRSAAARLGVPEGTRSRGKACPAN